MRLEYAPWPSDLQTSIIPDDIAHVYDRQACCNANLAAEAVRRGNFGNFGSL